MNVKRIVLVAAAALFLLLPPGIGAAEKPSLIIVLSVDQMRADYLDRFRPWFGEDGFNRFLRRGAVFTNARHRHAVTFTCPGHASIGSGLDPRDHGIVGNLWYDRNTGREVYCVEDRQTSWVGVPADAPRIPIAPASPIRLAGASLGDRLKERFPESRVVGIALKDRAAVLMAGRKADAAIWFEERFARFVTSTYYPPHSSLLAFDETLPVFFAAAEHRSWTLSGRIPPADLERVTFDPPELYPAKNPLEGYGVTFPHPLATPRAIVSSPWGDVLVLDLARFVIEQMRLGSRDDVPDLLFVGLSSTDYYGHMFGPDSKEIADGIVRLDTTLERFFRWLDAKRGGSRVLVFLTADHGVQPLPEVARARRKAAAGVADTASAGRVDLSSSRNRIEAKRPRDLSDDRLALEKFLAGKFGYEIDLDGPIEREAAIADFQEPGLTVNRAAAARRGLDVERVKAAVRDWVRTRPGVLSAWTNTEISNGLPPAAPHALAVERSFRADRSCDVFVVLKPGWIWSSGIEAGTTHGQPNDDDTRVPLAVFGAGVTAGVRDTPVSPLSIARTVAAIFGFEAGEPDVDVLEPVLGTPAAVHAGASR